MKVITPESIAFRGNQHPVLTVNKKGLFFNLAASEQFGLQTAQRLRFINDETYWAFTPTSEPDSFVLVKYSRPISVRINSATLAGMMMESLGIDNKDANVYFSISKSSAEFNGNPIFEIDTSKRAKPNRTKK